MAKKKSNLLFYLFLLLAIVAAGVGIASIMLPAFTTTLTVGSQKFTTDANVLSFLFGQGTLNFSLNDGDPITTTLTGGISYLGLGAFIALCLGTLLLIVVLFSKSKGLAVVAALLLIAGGVSIFFFRELGAPITAVADNPILKILINFQNMEYADFWKAMGGDNVVLGIGAIVFGAGACASGLFTLIAAICKR